ncbi:MAG TPA: glycoside hydrolase family 31 protein [Kiritimatiellia bacterium]|nr:glycoside hydrolase family 31 protein [Kiritimatiellia bacterium]
MYFRKLPHIANFDFLASYKAKGANKIEKDRFDIELTAYKGSIFRLRVKNPRWKKNYSQAGLSLPPKVANPRDEFASLHVDSRFGLKLTGPGNRILLSSPPRQTFGISGTRSVFVFNQEPEHQFFGMGEKMRGLELSGIQTKFWNTDIFADFHWKEIENDRPDPMYASIPYLIVKRDNQYIGLLLDNPYATFMTTSAPPEIGGGQMKLSNIKERYITIGAEHGQPDLYILVGPTLAELTRKLQRLVGTTPLPPAWALGYHQCRWGYKSEACLKLLDDGFTSHGIPCDGLWLDIDYMDSFKVFTFNKTYFPNVKKRMAALARKGRKVIPIIDPGVKRERGYSVYESGRKAKAFCLNPQGKEFIGLVWPGETVFPDFSTLKGRAWWAKHVKEFAAHGFPGAWLDMNDPSTGSVLCTDMRFNQGKESHYTYHNQYALGMAQASRDGFAAAHPGLRPFLLSRSGFTGISKYAALWTGDNMANYHYLRNSIPVSINLALSGVPFNGPDIGGFAGDTTPQLITDWMKTCFLFPFCRNHSMIGTRDQEPWAFDPATRDTLKHYIQLRYKLRPYLYNLFIQQEREGEAILRPLFYHFPDTPKQPLTRIADQFMIGSGIMQAPVIDEHRRDRDVVLPGQQPWFSTLHGEWIKPGQTLPIAPKPRQTALFLRDAAVLPMTPGPLPTQNTFDSRAVEFHLFLHPGSDKPCVYEYTADDGLTLDYQQGKRSSLLLTASVRKRETLAIHTEKLLSGYGKIKTDFVIYSPFPHVTLNGKPAKLKPFTWEFAGSKVKAWRVQPTAR